MCLRCVELYEDADLVGDGGVAGPFGSVAKAPVQAHHVGGAADMRLVAGDLELEIQGHGLLYVLDREEALGGIVVAAAMGEARGFKLRSGKLRNLEAGCALDAVVVVGRVRFLAAEV